MQFTIAPGQKIEYEVFGYQYANLVARKILCFSSNTNTVQNWSLKCPLGAYFDTEKMKAGDKIYYLGVADTFARMNYVSGNGKKMIFYLPKSCFAIK